MIEVIAQEPIAGWAKPHPSCSGFLLTQDRDEETTNVVKMRRWLQYPKYMKTFTTT